MKQWKRKLWMVILLVSGFSGCSLADIKEGRVIKAGTDYIFSARFDPEHSIKQVFIDADGDATTGYPVGGIGAEYLLEDDWFYQHQGGDWNWRFVAEVPGFRDDGRFAWRLPGKHITSSGNPIIVFAGAGNWDTPEFSPAISTRNAALVSHSLVPYKIKTRRGSESDQGMAALARKDQSGSQDKWDDYIEFYPGDKGYAGQFYLRLPKKIQVSDIVRLKVHTNYRGERKKYQRWIWKIYNFNHGRWQILGDNQKAPGWRWKSLTFLVEGDPAAYVSAKGLIKLRYETSRNTDNSQLDLLKLVAEVAVPDNSKPVEEADPARPEPPGSGEEEPAEPEPSPAPETPAPTSWHPRPGMSWQWQLSGTIDTSVAVDIFDVDLFDTPQETIDLLHRQGKKVVCYFSAGTYENWRPDKSKFPKKVIGRRLDDWEGESWLDIRRLDKLRPIMVARIELAKQKGCDGVEPDNVDGYDNKSGFPLKAKDQIRFNRMLAAEAHKRGLSIALKNTLELVAELEPDFDWALNEQCFQYQECEMLQPFLDAGKAVLGVSYVSEKKAKKICPKANQMGFSWLVKKWDLDAWRMDCRDFD